MLSPILTNVAQMSWGQHHILSTSLVASTPCDILKYFRDAWYILDWQMEHQFRNGKNLLRKPLMNNNLLIIQGLIIEYMNFKIIFSHINSFYFF